MGKPFLPALGSWELEAGGSGIPGHIGTWETTVTLNANQPLPTPGP